MEFVPIEPRDVPEVNKLMKAAKSYWDYEDDYLERALKLIGIDEDWIGSHEGYTLRDKKGELIGFLGVEKYEDYWYLEHLWIKPEHIGESLGRQALDFMFEKARRQGVRTISLLPDPFAEGFYEKLGAYYTGVDVASRVEGGPVFREMKFDL